LWLNKSKFKIKGAPPYNKDHISHAIYASASFSVPILIKVTNLCQFVLH